MSVLIEAISVIIQRRAIEDRYPGGLSGFLEAQPNAMVCYDDHLVRIGFMDPRDVRDYISQLEARGLVFDPDGGGGDLCFVDQLQGLTGDCDWLVSEHWVLGPDAEVSSVRHADDDSTGLALPGDWKFEGSFSDKFIYVPAEEMSERLKPLGEEDGVRAFLDRQTGKKVYLGSARPPEADAEYAAIARITQRALALAQEADAAFRTQDTEAGGAIYLELTDELLPEIRQLIDRAHHHVGLAHHAHGLVLRVLKLNEEALEQFLKAHDYLPEATNPLLEIVRCYGELARPADAEPYARRGVEVDPDSPATWGNLAMTLIQLRQREEARPALDRALELDPDNAINMYMDEHFDAYFG